MESKILNFPDAMRLASILSKYIKDPKSLVGMDAYDVFPQLFSEIEDNDIVNMLELLHIKANNSPQDILNLWITACYENSVVNLLDFYKAIGFVS